MTMEVVVHEWEGWLADVSNRTLPGGVAVAAVAAAMGAALVAKAIRVTVSRGDLPPDDRREFEAAAAEAREAQAALLGLSMDDEAAYRRVLSAGREPAAGDERDDERREAWLMAIDVPLRVAETCQDLLELLAPLHNRCLPAVLVDLEIGTRLLLAGLDAGVRAGRANVREWRDELLPDPAADDVARRLEGLGRKRT